MFIVKRMLKDVLNGRGYGQSVWNRLFRICCKCDQALLWSMNFDPFWYDRIKSTVLFVEDTACDAKDIGDLIEVQINFSCSRFYVILIKGKAKECNRSRWKREG